VRVVVDNSAGGDSQFAQEVTDALRARGVEVELRPSRGATFDTAVHQVDAGTVIRLAERPDPEGLHTIESVVRAALEHRHSLRRRTRSVPVRLGETERAIAWIDVFG
jgi:NADPH-dependent glutamate synthase beta subunit-like oxidoreductase